MIRTTSIIVIFLLLELTEVRCEEQSTPAPAGETQDQDSSSNNNLASWATISLDDPMEGKTKYVGERLNLECYITGVPLPQYTWSKNGQIINSDGRVIIRTVDWGSRLRINSLELSDAGIYACKGVNLKGTKTTEATVNVQPVSAQLTTPRQVLPSYPPDNRPAETIKDDNKVDEPFCQDYKGSYCALLSSQSLYVKTRRSQVEAETDVINMIKEFSNIDLRADTECFMKSVQAMCYLKMPLCGPPTADGKPTEQKLCLSECQELFPVCKKHLNNDQSNWRILPDCSQLNDEPECLKIGLAPTTTKSEAGVGQEKTDEDVSDLLLQIVLPVVLGLIIVLVIIVVSICICRKRKQNQPNSPTSSNGRLTSSVGKSYEMASGSEKSASVYVKDIPADNIHFIQELGTGIFGKVFKGQVFGLYGNGTASLVFVKALKEQPTIKEQQDFQNEINAMTDLRHQHIITLLAISTKGNPQCILYEHLPLGNLNQFLLSQQTHTVLQHKEVMYILTQIASGFEYLSSQKFIHKDIAARNVMVSHNLNVKLSNLKIIYGLNSVDYCSLHNNMIAVRWCPPETITYGQFTLETDVYSYGILMWEVFNGGQQPYGGFSNEEVIEMVRSRQLLACPNNCPPRVYSLMMECWHEIPDKRPTAKEVHQKMRAWYLDNSNPYALSSTSAPSVSNSSAHSHHSSNGQNFANSQTNNTATDMTGNQSTSPQPLQQPPYNQLHSTPSRTEKPPFYNSIFPEGQANRRGKVPRNGSDLISTSCSETEDNDDESEFAMPIPNNHTPVGNPYSSLNRRPRVVQAEYGSQTQPFLPQDHV